MGRGGQLRYAHRSNRQTKSSALIEEKLKGEKRKLNGRRSRGEAFSSPTAKGEGGSGRQLHHKVRVELRGEDAGRRVASR